MKRLTPARQALEAKQAAEDEAIKIAGATVQGLPPDYWRWHDALRAARRALEGGA